MQKKPPEFPEYVMTFGAVSVIFKERRQRTIGYRAEATMETIALETGKEQLGWRNLWPSVAFRTLNVKKSRSTLHRCMDSRHVADLRLFFGCAVLALILGFCVFCSVEAYLHLASPAAQTLPGGKDDKAVSGSWATLIAALLAGIGALVAWCYQTASKRLGVVDLFGCEISAIARIYAVAGFVQRMIEAYHTPAAAKPDASKTHLKLDRIKLNESYTPVMDHVIGDLQQLDAEVVSSTTEFYTYRRTMMDYITNAGDRIAAAPAVEQQVTRKYFYFQIIYMLYLSMESARRAVWELIEYQPNRAECCVNILLTELTAYEFLVATLKTENTTFLSAGPIPADNRLERLKLRRERYVACYETLKREIGKAEALKAKNADAEGRAAGARKSEEASSQEAEAWDRAITTFPVLTAIFERIFPDAGSAGLSSHGNSDSIGDCAQKDTAPADERRLVSEHTC